MARKQRDYKAEYAAAKRRATRAGYKSEREYKRIRKELRLPKNTSPIPKTVYDREKAISSPGGIGGRMRRIRRESQAWSDQHSRVTNSRFDPACDDSTAELYYHAFVEPLAEVDQDTTVEKLSRIRRYMVPFLMTGDDWNSNPSTIPLRR